MNEAPRGLSAAEVSARQARDGFNELAGDGRRTWLGIAAEVSREPMFLLILGAGGIYLLMGDAHDAAVLLGFVVIIMTVTILQEQRTERALDALRDLSSPRALALRDGVPTRIPGREVVVDDLLVLAEGDRVPADGQLLQAHELAADESLLTGESVPVAKFVTAAAADRVFAGTLVVAGQGLLRVTAIGNATELGRIGKSLGGIVSEPSPVQAEMAALTKRLALIAVSLCLLVASLFVLLRGDWLQGLLAGIALAMSLLPEEVPVILIVFLALGARRLAAQRVLTRRLNAIETLGEATVLCVDKTGTLTRNRMAVACLAVDGRQLDLAGAPAGELPEEFHELLEYGVLASEIAPHDPMEQALHGLARATLADTEHLHPDWDLAREYELTPELLAMSHLWRIPEHRHQAVAAKGAPEAIADLCHLPPGQRDTVAREAAALAERGLRVLAVAKAEHRDEAGGWPDIQHDFDFRYLGLIGLADPLRPEVPAAVAECRRAGIRVVMITGDHPRTAQAIAQAAGIDAGRVVTGAELEQGLPPDLRGVSVFARVAPQQKLAIVEALKAQGEVVAMTGDGVNDAPALKAAHIGVAMGRRGTDVAREAASLVLLEDDFGAIVAAVRLGRRIFANLRQALIYTLAVHLPIVGLSLIPLLFGQPLLLLPVHIAFLELVIGPTCSVVFEACPEDANIMARPPRPRAERLLSGGHVSLAMFRGLLATLAVAAVYGGALAAGIAVDEARAMAFVALVGADGALVLTSAAARQGLPVLGRQVLAITLAGLVAVTAIPALAGAFAFTPPTFLHWLAALAAGTAPLLLLPRPSQLR